MRMHRSLLSQLARHFSVALLAVVFIACSSGNGDSSTAEHASKGTEKTQVDADHPQRVAQGEPIELADYAVEGQIVVFDFMSDYCPPCQRMSPWMDRLHKERDDITVVKVDINRPGVRGIDWGSPIVKKFKLQAIPHFKVMNAEGQLLAEGEAAQQMVIEWLQELPTPEG